MTSIVFAAKLGSMQPKIGKGSMPSSSGAVKPGDISTSKRTGFVSEHAIDSAIRDQGVVDESKA